MKGRAKRHERRASAEGLKRREVKREERGVVEGGKDIGEMRGGGRKEESGRRKEKTKESRGKSRGKRRGERGKRTDRRNE